MDRRTYSRLESGVECLVYMKNKEMDGIIDNISESGMAVLIDTNGIKCEICVGDRASVTAIDDTGTVIQFNIEAVRIASKNECRLIGAKIINQTEIEPYITRKRVEKYIRSISPSRRTL
ncbi:MAG: PilZ domain-containing protein [Lachnospiraceae bacterium]|nr:PilZ domain-containing protein [Lachnospiraceae bacterium]